MRFLKKQEYAGTPKWLFPFLIGFLAGILILNAGAEFFVQNSGLLDAYTLGRMKYMEINYNTFFIFVLKSRFSTIWLLMLLSTTFLGVFALYGYILWLGAAGGILLSAAIIRYGMKGILLMLMSALPQFIIYIPACIFMVNLGYRVCTNLYFPGRTTGGGYQNKKQMLLQWLVSFLMLHIVVIIGAILESYVNPIIITKILKIF